MYFRELGRRFGLVTLWGRYLRWHMARFRFRLVWCQDLPDKLKFHTIYIVGTREHPWQAVFGCPCGCGDTIYIGVSSGGWKLVFAAQRKISLRPSIFRTVGCRSHFFIEDCKVKWC